MSQIEPIVHWKYNEGADAPPPSDADTWIGVCRTLRLTWAEFVLHEQGKWHISRADGLLEGSNYADRKRELSRALLAEGLPLDSCCEALASS
jgi:hypothetical protein